MQRMRGAGSQGAPGEASLPDAEDLQQSIVHFVSSGYLDTVTQVCIGCCCVDWWQTL